jgi:MYXO-CTERM domain-containing protein
MEDDPMIHRTILLALLSVVLLAEPAEAITTVGVDAGGAIPPSSSVTVSTFTFQVDGLDVIEDLDLRLSVYHDWVSDLAFTLTSPSGTRRRLFDYVGFGSGYFQDTILDDEADRSIRRGRRPYAGSYQPENSLAIFDGEQPNGLWTLEVEDRLAGQTGQLYAPGDRQDLLGTALLFDAAELDGDDDNGDTPPIPEPMTATGLALAGLAVGGALRRRTR